MSITSSPLGHAGYLILAWCRPSDSIHNPRPPHWFADTSWPVCESQYFTLVGAATGGPHQPHTLNLKVLQPYTLDPNTLTLNPKHLRL
jgi:hypothetical protein